jgi:pimeloyl-ACP methyl ester carboxylesterase
MRQYPANPMQAAAYHRYLSAPCAPGANTQVSISFGESTNSDFLRQAWQVVIQRHPILRSAFTKTMEGVMVREADKAEPHWISLDWQSIPAEEIPSKWNDLLAADALADFEPIAIPLIRFHEIRLPGGAGHYLLTAPAFLLDEFSITRVLLDLLLTLGQAPLSPAGNLPEYLKPKGWTDFLKNAEAPLRLEPRFGNGEQVRASLLLNRDKTSAFSKFCLDHDLEESLALRCLWSLLLRRFGASGNVLLTLFDARGESTEAGFFQNWLPVVHSWSESVEDWLDAEQALTDAMSENIWIEGDEALRGSGLDFTQQDIAATFAWRGSSINDIIHTALPRWINFDAQLQQTTLQGLVLEARPGPRLELSLTGPFGSEPVLKDFLGRLIEIIGSLSGNLGKPVNRMPVLLPDEILQLRDWSRGPEIHQQPASVVEAFRKVVQRNPESIAVKFGDYEMTYAELDALSDKLAAHLAQTGLAGGWHAALFLSPSAWISVAMLGAWKAGNSCLAIDPTAPADWVESTLAAHDVALVFCDGASSASIDAGTRRRIIIDQDWETLEAAPAEPRNVGPDELAATMPGHSDGAPPMVRALTHGMLVSAALEGARILDFQPGHSFLVRSMPGAGAFFDEWLIPLLAGGTAYVAGYDMVDSAAAPVTHLRLTTPEWANQAADWGHEGEPCSPTLRCVAVEAGSPLLTSASIWQKQSTSPFRQVVFFSPASLCGLGLAGVIRKNAVRIPTGKPTAECEAVIADADGLEIPPGYVGRLFLKFPGWKNLPDAGGRLGFDTGLNAWRDWEGDLYVESGLRKVNGLPTAEEIKSVRELFPQVLDVFVSLQGVFALSDQAVGHAVCQKQWLLNRAGWIDESALPQPAQPVASQPQPSVAPASPKAAEPAVQTRRAPQSAWTPLVEMCSKGSGSTLVLVHPANGLTDSYSELLYALGNSRRVIGIAARGALNPEACHPSIESAAAQYIAALFEDAPLQNFQLAGFGFGAIVALEMARQLQAAARTLPRLVLIGAMPPPTDEPGGWLASMKKVFMRSATASRMEPLAPSSAAAMRHEAILKNYRFPTCDIPATIVLPADLAESSAPWQELLPSAAVEITRSSWSEMLSNPGVKRIASILAEDKL